MNIYLTNEEFDKAKENQALPRSRIPRMRFCGSAWGPSWTTWATRTKPLRRTSRRWVKADYFDANYNLGALYFNQAVQGINEQRHGSPMTKAESDAQKLEDDAKALFATAKPYLKRHMVDVRCGDHVR